MPTHSLLTPGYRKRTMQKILKICQITEFDMGFQKINMIFCRMRKLGEASIKLKAKSKSILKKSYQHLPLEELGKRLEKLILILAFFFVFK
jgi:hypothetical protein